MTMTKRRRIQKPGYVGDHPRTSTVLDERKPQRDPIAPHGNRERLHKTLDAWLDVAERTPLATRERSFLTIGVRREGDDVIWYCDRGVYRAGQRRP